jgi:hypothetical protein
MSENSNHGWGRSTTVALPAGHPTAGHEPAFEKSVGTSRRGTVWVGSVDEQRGPGIQAQEMAGGRVTHQVRAMDQGGKTIGVWSAPTAAPFAFLTADGNRLLDREPTVRDCVNVPGVGVMRVREALALGVLRSDDLQVSGASPMADYEALKASRQQQAQDAKQPEQAPQVPEADQALQAEYNAVAGDLNKAMQSVGVSSENVLDALSKGDERSLATAAQAVAGKMGSEQFAQTVEALTLHTYAAVDRALAGTGADLDDVLNVLEQPANSRRWLQCASMYLRTGNSELLSAFSREVARGMAR